MNINEKDWKMLRKKLPDWQENYMERLNNEYMAILSSDELPSTKFWELEKRINSDKRDTGVMVKDMSRSRMTTIIMDLLNEGAITIDDLSDFSEDLKELMRRFYSSR